MNMLLRTTWTKSWSDPVKCSLRPPWSVLIVGFTPWSYSWTSNVHWFYWFKFKNGSYVNFRQSRNSHREILYV